MDNCKWNHVKIWNYDFVQNLFGINLTLKNRLYYQIDPFPKCSHIGVDTFELSLSFMQMRD